MYYAGSRLPAPGRSLSMIPLRDVIPSRTTPVVTTTLIALNVLVFLYQWSLGPREANEFVRTWGLVPADFTLVSMFTSMFLHGGFLHVGGNMLYMWIFGDNVEDRIGRGRFVAFYLACGFIAALTQMYVNSDSTRADGRRQRRDGRGDGRLLRHVSALADSSRSSRSSFSRSSKCRRCSSCRSGS